MNDTTHLGSPAAMLKLRGKQRVSPARDACGPLPLADRAPGLAGAGLAGVRADGFVHADGTGAHDTGAREDFFENGGIGVQMVAPDGTLLSANRVALEIFGCASKDGARTNIAAFLSDPDVAEDIRLRLSRGEKLDKYPARLIARDGSLREVLITSSPRFQGGRLIDTRLFTVDVTRRMPGEDAPLAGDARLMETYERAAVGLSEAGLDGCLLRVNATVCAITGYAREELLGRSFFDLTVPEDRDKDEEFYRRHIAGEIETYRFEKRLLRKDGVKAWVSVRSTLVRDGAGIIQYTVRAIQDISRRKIVEQKLLESERQTRELLESLPVAVYTTDAEGRVTFYNKAAETLAGRTPQIGDEGCVVWRLYWPDGTPMPLDECPMTVALKENREVRGVEMVGERPDGTRVPIVPFPTPLRDGEGNAVGAVNVLIDLSERKQAEANQRILLKELNHRVKNNLQMLYSLLRSAARETENAEARAALGEATHRVGAIAAAQRVLYDVGSDVRFAAENFFETICASARQTLGHSIVIDVDPIAPVELSNDSAMPLALIMNELLTNAAKYGGSAERPVHVRVGLACEGDTLVLSVEDDGPGFQIQSVRKRSSGLGLVGGLARQLGGSFDVERGKGARCVVRFAHRGIAK